MKKIMIKKLLTGFFVVFLLGNIFSQNVFAAAKSKLLQGVVTSVLSKEEVNIEVLIRKQIVPSVTK